MIKFNCKSIAGDGKTDFPTAGVNVFSACGAAWLNTGDVYISIPDENVTDTALALIRETIKGMEIQCDSNYNVFGYNDKKTVNLYRAKDEEEAKRIADILKLMQ